MFRLISPSPQKLKKVKQNFAKKRRSNKIKMKGEMAVSEESGGQVKRMPLPALAGHPATCWYIAAEVKPYA